MSSYTTDGDDVSSISSDPPARTDFDLLIENIKDVLGPSSGIDSEDVDVKDLVKVMRDYESVEDDWAEFAFGDLSRNYARNLIDEINGKANLLLLVWTPGKGSLVHDHANAHCIMKVLKGKLEENLYDWPDKGLVQKGQKSPLKMTKTTTYEENEVAYISDEIGLHRISNPDPQDVAISLHLYTPPYAAKFGCHKFDEKTGKRSHIRLTDYYSAYGRREGLGLGDSV